MHATPEPTPVPYAMIQGDYPIDVLEFLSASCGHIAAGPTIPTQSERNLSRSLIVEEFAELVAELDRADAAAFVGASSETRTGVLAALLGEAVDLVWVTIRMCMSYGLPFDEAWQEIRGANMRKTDNPVFRADGKMIKPEGWEPADIERIVGLAVAEHEKAAASGKLPGPPSPYSACGHIHPAPDPKHVAALIARESAW